ncbi:MAG: hypothetical protein ACP5NX_00415 [Candidatus Bilamarchaeaceae archaeon]
MNGKTITRDNRQDCDVSALIEGHGRFRKPKRFPDEPLEEGKLSDRQAAVGCLFMALIMSLGIAGAAWQVMNGLGNLGGDDGRAVYVASKKKKSSVCRFQGQEMTCNPDRNDADEAENYTARLSYTINRENPKAVELLEKTVFIISPEDTGTMGGTNALGTYAGDYGIIEIFSGSNRYGHEMNTGVHEYLHAVRSKLMGCEERIALDGLLDRLRAAAEKFETGKALPLPNGERMRPMEYIFLARVKRLLEHRKKDCRETYRCRSEMYSHIGEETDIGIPPELMRFYEPYLSKRYLGNHAADPDVRFWLIIGKPEDGTKDTK